MARSFRHRDSLPALALAALLLAACAGQEDSGALDFPVDPGNDGKTDTFGRRLAGIAADYEAAELDEELLVSDHLARRQAAWATVDKIVGEVPLLGLAESAGEHAEIELPEGEVPTVPRFQTWYGIDDFKRIFQDLYQGIGASGRAVNAPFSAGAIEQAFIDNAYALDRSKRWPLERYLRYVKQLGVCPEEMPADECANLVQEKTAGAASGNSRILYSPATIEHILANYGRVLDCTDELDQVGLEAQPAAESNFTLCFASEFPNDAVLVKAQWARAEFGKEVPVYDTDADALAARLAGTAHWGEDGDRTADPGPGSIYTIRLRSGDIYRLVGLHIMTKELRHWQWITLWWSDRPDTDFGADRPETLGGRALWSSYKMCVVDSFEEGDSDPAARFEDRPSLAAALRAIDNGAGGPTWCSNPYLEHGRNNARTNCIGCHQHGGSTVIRDVDGDDVLDLLDLDAIINDEDNFPLTGRQRIRDLFPADYLYSFNRVDDFAQVMKSEVSFWSGADDAAVRPRVDNILSLTGDAEIGGERFAAYCSRCHGTTGEGSGWAPNLYERVPSRDDESIAQTLIQGRGGMPAWGDTFDDAQIADLLAFLRGTFGG